MGFKSFILWFKIKKKNTPFVLNFLNGEEKSLKYTCPLRKASTNIEYSRVSTSIDTKDRRKEQEATLCERVLHAWSWNHRRNPKKSLGNCYQSKKKSHPQICFPAGDPVAWTPTCPKTTARLNSTGHMRNIYTSLNQ